MASVIEQANGRKRLEFTVGKKRQRIRLGKAPLKLVEAYKVKIEQLVVAANLSQSPDEDTSRWVVGLGDKMHAKLAAAGLVKSRSRGRMTLRQLLDAFFDN